MKYEIEIIRELQVTEIGQPQMQVGFYTQSNILYCVSYSGGYPLSLDILSNMTKPLQSSAGQGGMSEDALLKLVGMITNNDVSKAVFK